VPEAVVVTLLLVSKVVVTTANELVTLPLAIREELVVVVDNSDEVAFFEV